MKIFDIIVRKLNKKTQQDIIPVTNPMTADNSATENPFLARMSKHAVNLFERQCDIKNFTKLALSDPENTTHNARVEALLKEDVLDPLSDEVIKQLSENEDLLNDLGL